jgi:hypothetical protein
MVGPCRLQHLYVAFTRGYCPPDTSGGQSAGQYPRVNKTRTVRRPVRRTVRRIRHVEFLGQSAGQYAGQYPRVNKTRTVRRTVREIMQIIAVNQTLTFGRWVTEILVLASLFRHAFLLGL